jgi:hypothetical protein
LRYQVPIFILACMLVEKETYGDEDDSEAV